MPHQSTLALVNLIDSIAAKVPHGRFLTLLHLGCGVPDFLAASRAFADARLAYRGVEEDQGRVDAAAAQFPGLRFICRQLDTFTRPEADVILVGPGIFRMCGGGAAQLLKNLNGAICSHLLIATVPEADNAARESLITDPRTHVPLDVVALRLLRPPEPARLITATEHCAYAYWER